MPKSTNDQRVKVEVGLSHVARLGVVLRRGLREEMARNNEAFEELASGKVPMSPARQIDKILSLIGRQQKLISAALNADKVQRRYGKAFMMEVRDERPNESTSSRGPLRTSK